jgi:hypothetical protein
MSRIAVALLGGWLSLCFLISGASMAMATEHAHRAVVLHAGNDADTTTERKKVSENPVKEPARQVPVEPFDEPARDESEKEPEKPAGEAAEKKQADESGAESKNKALKKAPEKSTKPPAAKAREEKPEKKTKARVRKGSSAKEAEMTVPGLPIRKPRKPVFRKKKESVKARKNPALPSGVRNKKLCKVLQKCRNEFIKCKSKIKHPDQSEPWIIAKEVCGGYYKTCVEKEFQPGEWFMTRWFYFQELNCSE